MRSLRRTTRTARSILVLALLPLALPLAAAGEGERTTPAPAGAAAATASMPGIAGETGHAHENCPFLAQMAVNPAEHAGEAPATALPSLPGQGAFGAIQEIVALLDADPATDWRTVDIRALRDHLVDMNELVLNAEVTETPTDGGFTAAVGGSGRTLDAIHHMLPMHVRMLGMEQAALRADWRETEGGGVLTVTAEDPAAAARLRALGFYGVMALGDHHRRHHLGIATGRMHH